jgi:hypothetical protein
MRLAGGLGLFLLAVALLGGSATASAPPAGGAVVLGWNDEALESVRAKRATDAQSARLYAMVNAAMYDAVNGIAGAGGHREAAIVAPRPGGVPGDPAVAAAVAAHDVLAGLYPDRTAVYDARLAGDVAGAVSAEQAAKGREWGASVAAGVLAARAGDGSASNEFQAGSSEAGFFTAGWNGTQFRAMKPFAIADPDAYVSDSRPPLTSTGYAAAFDEVKALGGAVPADAGKLATFEFWRLQDGTEQPPGAWLEVAQAVSSSRGLGLADTARLFALESIAMADTVAPTVKTKWTYRSWRPATAIVRADEDGNPATAAESGWRPRGGGAGSTPEHWSGHSSFSASAATVLAGFFCRDDVPFTLTTDTAPGAAARSYESFSAAAAEAGRSRILGGLHFEFSNQAGLTAGRAIATEVLATALQPLRAGAPSGACR